MLRAFEWKWRSSLDGGAPGRRSGSMVSPGCSRVGSVDEGEVAPGRMGSVGRSLGRRSSEYSIHGGQGGRRPTGEIGVIEE